MTPAPPEPHPKLTWKAFLRDFGLTIATSVGAVVAGASVLFTLLMTIGNVHFAAESHEQALLDLQNLQYALKHFHAKHQRYPSTEEGLQMLVDSRYLEQLPLDPWGQHYGYELREGLPVLWSYGADGAPGGEGPDADIFSRTKGAQAAGVCAPGSHQ
ncbi:type II secretion system protein GspG [Archangium lansingense]|uniref:Type II secretion system protein GspG n=1 Tax=Archangium lansingense TaxID=2995310 RepID=A0ABT3ZWB1_9BACT|nr:type II secretion system protein GspG [Archangium lansinium]MCY1073697.1 type II secretion system protein GspG [Archangium lansinium]